MPAIIKYMSPLPLLRFFFIDKFLVTYIWNLPHTLLIPLPLEISLKGSHVFCPRKRKHYLLLLFELSAISSHLLLYGSPQALIDATASESTLEDETGVRMVALFDHEEIGSNSAQGAGSPVMFDALSRITNSFTSDPKVVTEK